MKFGCGYKDVQQKQKDIPIKGLKTLDMFSQLKFPEKGSVLQKLDRSCIVTGRVKLCFVSLFRWNFKLRKQIEGLHKLFRGIWFCIC